jgi:hypothetical protein
MSCGNVVKNLRSRLNGLKRCGRRKKEVFFSEAEKRGGLFYFSLEPDRELPSRGLKEAWGGSGTF